ncbi:hypothetical protein WD019_19170 [Fictibacillus sp. Mic-4]|uniref:hypothetical protein n=1 Tax=Fictibacillus TaxID=1329200 RepID=UPI0004264C04|nr:hypothetical protein [Fictibacillus gelatini]
MARRAFRKYRMPNWLQNIRDVVAQFTIPLIVFQLIRTIIFPSAVDFFLILILLVLHLCFTLEVF